MSFKSFFLSLTIVAILLFSAFGTTVAAYADDGTTSPPTEPGTPAPGTDGEVVTPVVTETAPVVDGTEPPVATEVAPGTDGATETPIVTEVAPGTDVATETPVVTETAPEVAPEPILEQLPDDTTVAVVNAEGEAQPLASQASADAILLSDPIWCPAGQAPTPGANGCTQSYSSFTQLLTFLKANEGTATYQQAGTIYVQQGAYLGGESSINFNSYNFTSLNQQNLTITGGWNTVNNTVTSTSQFTAPIIIGTSANPWAGSLSFNNIVINNVSNQTGLTAYSQSDITVSNVQVTNSLNGANLNSGKDVIVSDSKFDKNKNTGATINATGVVGISNTSFNGNGSKSNTGKGLEIKSGSIVSLSNVQANNNQLFGANINANGIVAVVDSFFNGNQSYSYNCSSATYGGYGLQIVSNTRISLLNVQASKNYLFGASLTGPNIAVSGDFSYNGAPNSATGKGLDINSSGPVSLSNVTANYNQLYGANIQAQGTVQIFSSFFSGNKGYVSTCGGSASSQNGYGLQVVTTSNILVNQVTANDNDLFGSSLTGTDVSVSESFFSNNGVNKKAIGKGLVIVSSGAVAMDKVEANNNQLFGANVQAQGDVAISNSFFSGNKAYKSSCKAGSYDGYGLQVVTVGNVVLSGVNASNNHLYGAKLTGADVSAFDGIFSNNGSSHVDVPVGYGLDITSNGTVRMGNVTANDNQLYGANIKAVDRVLIGASFFTGNQSYMFNCNDEQVFYGYGLTVVTAGNILLDTVQANFNNLWGGSLTGLDVLVRNSQFNNNVSQSVVFIDDTGLLVNSAGNTTLDTVEAKENRLIGADIHAVGNILINNSIFTDNRGMTCDDDDCSDDVVYHGYGLSAIAGGSVELNGVTADRNNLFGAHLEGLSVLVTNSTFSNNGSGDNKSPTGKGLEVANTGDVTLNNVSANNNQLFGANIQATGLVTISNSVFSGNIYYTSGKCKAQSANGYGLQVVTTNNITLDNVTANDNGLYGATLDGSLVQVSNSTFENNVSSHGLAITADVVVVENVTATNNGVDGTIICANDVTVNNSLFTDNGRYGLNVGSPIFSESGNTYSGNGTGSLFYNPTCNPSGNGNGNGNQGHHHDDDKDNDHHGHHDGGNTSDHRCSNDKNDDKHGDKKHDDNKSGHHDSKTSDSRCSSDKSDKHGDNNKQDNKSGQHESKTSDSRCSSNKSYGKK